MKWTETNRNYRTFLTKYKKAIVSVDLTDFRQAIKEKQDYMGTRVIPEIPATKSTPHVSGTVEERVRYNCRS